MGSHAGHGHGDGHSHHHDGWGSRIRHALSEIFGFHSHDAAGSTDEALESSAKGIRALVISFMALIAFTI